MYFAAAVTSIAIGMTMLASLVRVAEVYTPEPEITVRQVVAPPKLALVIATPEPTPEPSPSPVLMALVRSTPAPAPVAIALTVATPVATPVAAVVQPLTPSTKVQAIYAALARSSWPSHLWDKVVQIAGCESSYDPDEIGDSGRALGLLQIRSDAHPDLVANYAVMTLAGNLEAAWLVYLRKGAMLGLPPGVGSFSPWSCA